MPNFADLLQLGFAGAMAFVLVFLIWKLSTFVITTFKEMQTEHSVEIRHMHTEHRLERDQCYASQAKRFDNFDQTLQMMAHTFNCKHGNINQSEGQK